MEYTVVSTKAWSLDTAVKVLEKKVNDMIKQGWEPTGGIVMVSFNDTVYQSMIKRD